MKKKTKNMTTRVLVSRELVFMVLVEQDTSSAALQQQVQ